MMYIKFLGFRNKSRREKWMAVYRLNWIHCFPQESRLSWTRRPKHHCLAILGGFHGYSHTHWHSQIGVWIKWELPTTLALSTCQESKYYPLSMSHFQTLLSVLLCNCKSSDIRKHQWIHKLLHSDRSRVLVQTMKTILTFMLTATCQTEMASNIAFPPTQLVGLIKRKNSNFTVFMVFARLFLLSWNLYSVYSASLSL